MLKRVLPTNKPPPGSIIHACLLAGKHVNYTHVACIHKLCFFCSRNTQGKKGHRGDFMSIQIHSHHRFENNIIKSRIEAGGVSCIWRPPKGATQESISDHTAKLKLLQFSGSCSKSV